MDNDITAILDEAIKIELNISDLYHIFSEKFITYGKGIPEVQKISEETSSRFTRGIKGSE